MSVIVRDTGFAPAETTAEDADAPPALAPETDLDALPPGALAALLASPMIRVAFPAFSDGRGFTIARRLRMAGYAGRLRACGPLIADQYTMARRSGFDEVEIPDDLAARQPEEQWRFRADWAAHDYRARLRPAAPHAA